MEMLNKHFTLEGSNNSIHVFSHFEGLGAYAFMSFNCLRISSTNVINRLSLRVLDLECIFTNQDALNNLLSTCKLLEKIKLAWCECLKNAKVQNLLRLTDLDILSTDYDNLWEINNVPCLSSFRYRHLFASWKPANFDILLCYFMIRVMLLSSNENGGKGHMGLKANAHGRLRGIFWHCSGGLRCTGGSMGEGVVLAGKTGWGLAQYSVGRNSKMAVRAGINNKMSGQITVKTSSSEHLALALTAVIPSLISAYKKLWPSDAEKYSAY
nr:translocase of chloroplast 159, chloroplastic [Tanacetum cinerariifolium]